MASDDEFVLEPCPCCGGAATMEHGAERSENGWVVCTECGLSTRYHHDPAEAAAEWNRRANCVNAAATREALEMARDALKSAEKYVYGDPPDGGAIGWDDVWPSEWHNALEAVERAISAPARNCDAMSRSICTKHFSTTYEGNRDGLCDVQTEREKNIHLYYTELIDWLFAPAAERDGDEK